ncbi:hypothetical protein J4458_01185 [Candidatus Woesearchaeota archaeon]|nr:hypothetical protein [Candidatus Woesearchaeota archaeon]
MKTQKQRKSNIFMDLKIKFSRKSQVHMGETIAVLLVFFILVLIGLIFYTRIIKGNIETEKEESRQLKAIEIAQRVSFLPELQCSEENIVTDNCIDIMKLDAASGIIRRNEIFYYDMLLFSNITLKEIYPEERQWDLYDRSLGNFTSKLSTNVPIALFNPITKKYSFGVMEVSTFTK